MISGKILQTYQGLSAQYQISADDGVSVFASIPYNVAMGSIFCEMMTGESYQLKFDFRNSAANWTKEIEKREYTRYQVIDEQGVEVGSVCRKRMRGLFGGYPYCELVLAGQTYHIYRVGLGKEGIRYPIYLQSGEIERQCAQIEKPCTVEDMRDEYRFRAVDRKAVAPVILFTLYEDLLYYGNRGEVPIRSKEIAYEVTWNKKLRAKYHTEF